MDRPSAATRHHAAGLVVPALAAGLVVLIWAQVRGGGIPAIDRLARSWVAEHQVSVVFTALNVIKDLGSWTVAVPLVLVIAAVLSLRRHSPRPLITAGMAIVGLAAITVLQASVARPGPSGAGPPAVSGAWPSGHAVTVVVAALLLVAFLPTRGTAHRVALGLAGLLVAVVAFALVYCGHHWLSDVAVALPLGFLIVRAATTVGGVSVAASTQLTVERPAARTVAATVRREAPSIGASTIAAGTRVLRAPGRTAEGGPPHVQVRRPSSHGGEAPSAPVAGDRPWLLDDLADADDRPAAPVSPGVPAALALAGLVLVTAYVVFASSAGAGTTRAGHVLPSIDAGPTVPGPPTAGPTSAVPVRVVPPATAPTDAESDAAARLWYDTSGRPLVRQLAALVDVAKGNIDARDLDALTLTCAVVGDLADDARSARPPPGQTEIVSRWDDAADLASSASVDCVAGAVAADSQLVRDAIANMRRAIVQARAAFAAVAD